MEQNTYLYFCLSTVFRWKVSERTCLSSHSPIRDHEKTADCTIRHGRGHAHALRTYPWIFLYLFSVVLNFMDHGHRSQITYIIDA